MKKRLIAILVTVIMLVVMLIPTTALANEGNDTEHHDYNITLCISVDIKAGAGGTIYSPSGQLGVNMSKNGVFSYKAVPNTGYAFDHWTYNGNEVSGAFLTSSTDPNLQVKFTKTGNALNYANYDAQAVFTPLPQRSLTVNTAGQGTVVKSPDPPYYDGMSVTLTANPADGWQFSGWSGDASGTSSKTSVAISGDKTVTATFTLLPTYTVTLNTVGNGTVSKNPDIDSYWQGRNVVLTASASSRWRFGSWSGDASGTSNPLTVSVNSNKNITANFIQQYYITLNTTSGGHYNSENAVEGLHDVNSVINLGAANPDNYGGNRFIGWRDDQTGQMITNYKTTDYTFTLTGDRSFTAMFGDLERLKLGFNDINMGSLKNDISGMYGRGASINLNDSQPTPKAGYTIDCWKEFGFDFSGSGKVVPLVSGQPIITIGDSNYFKAIFKTANYSITYDLNNGTVSGNPSSYTYFDNDIKLIDPSRPGYTFTGWTGTGLSEITKPVVIPNHSTGDRAYTAHWSAVPCSITYTLNGGTVSPANPTTYSADSAAITLKNPTMTGYTFTGWSGTGINGTSTSVTIPSGSTGDRAYTANWSLNHHDIIYMVDGTQYSKISGVAFGASISPIANLSKTGFTFSGWSTMPTTMPDSDVTVTGSFSVNHHDIIYTVDGTQYSKISGVAFGSSISPIASPTKVGFTFSGWSTMPTTMPDSDLTVTGSFSINYHSIIYMIDGAEYTRINGVAFGSAISPIASPTQVGFTFSGWSSMPSAMPDSDVTVKGSFSIKHHDIIYVVDGNEYTRVTGVAFASPISPIADLTKEGSTFSGWSTMPTTMPDSDVTVTGSFSVNHHDIIYMLDGVEYYRVSGVAFGTDISPIADLTKEGFTFSGWSTMPTSMPDSDVTVTGSFSINHHDIIYVVDGTEYTRVSGVAFGTDISPIAALTKEGYTFSGWSSMPDKMPDSDVTVTGSFSINHHVIVYMVDGTEYSRVKDVAFNSNIAPIAAPSKVGYTFSGWSYMPTSMPDSDVTVTGSFSVNHHNIIYMVGGTEYSRVKDVAYGTAIIVIAAPAKDGYTFSGWSSIPTTMPDSDLTVTGSFSINTYNVRFFKLDGTTQIGTTQKVDWGTAATLMTEPPRVGYRSVGWTLKGDDNAVVTNLSSVKENIDAVASYTRDSFTVTFYDEDGSTVLRTDKVYYGNDATAPADPAKEGYTFAGWSESFNNVTNDVNVYAKYSINTFTVTFKDYNGTVISTATVNWNANATAPSDPSRDGYTFAGWDVPFTNVKANLTVTAKYTAASVQSTSPASSPTVTITSEPVPTTASASNGWMWWLLLIIPVGLLIWFIIFMLRRKNEEEKKNNNFGN